MRNVKLSISGPNLNRNLMWTLFLFSYNKGKTSEDDERPL